VIKAISWLTISKVRERIEFSTMRIRVSATRLSQVLIVVVIVIYQFILRSRYFLGWLKPFMNSHRPVFMAFCDPASGQNISLEFKWGREKGE
jgi:hypothetical protein